ncbi:MAG: divalent heavy-metal cations transporter, partial [Firmicutes bacterium]|nr:divalent heavy-metal cations transporter [Bacillota bacterium]
MGVILTAAALGFVLGFTGTAGGGLLVLIRRPSPVWQARLLGVAGGIMLAVSFFDLWPGAWRAGGL